MKMCEIDTVGDVLVHGPTLQSVEVLVPPRVPLGKEPRLAVLAPVPEGFAADHPPADSPSGKLKVVGYLRACSLWEPNDPYSSTVGAGVSTAFHLPRGPQASPLLAVQNTSPPDHFAGPEEDLLPLVIEV